MKIVAHQPISREFFKWLGPAVDSGPADIHDQSSHDFTVTQGRKVVLDFHFEGHGIQYFSGVPYRGTIDKVSIDLDGALAYKFTGDKYSVAKGLDLYLQNDPQKIIKAITRGDDDIRLSDFDDDMTAGKGNDKVKGNGGNDVIKGASGDDDLRGGTGDDTLKGGGGKDRLDGGAGDNMLTGNKGMDTYVFKDAPLSGVSTITDFKPGETIALDHNDFTGIGGKGALKAGFFHAGTDAADFDDHIVYDSATGALFFDADGNGAGLKVQFAQFKAGLELTNGDFLII